MTKPELIQLLKSEHQNFVAYIEGLNEAEFMYSFQNTKWTAGQQLQHLNISISTLLLAFRLPYIVLPLLFGKANRSSRTYEELVLRYQDKLLLGGKAPSRFSPSKIPFNQKKILQQKLLKLTEQLCNQLDQLSENQIDKLILPHPLLGKVTLREMFYFTLYHVRHHHKQCVLNLKNQSEIN